jgi:hypothetical protein
MSADTPHQQRTQLTEEEAHRLLARAVELDARHVATLSVGQLREAAQEAGIRAEAFDQAWREFQSLQLPGADSPLRSRHRSLADHLARYRRHAFVGSLLLLALISRGDEALRTLLVSPMLYGAYEAVIAIVRRLSRRTTTTHPGVGSRSSEQSFPGSADQGDSALLLVRVGWLATHAQ